MTCTRRRRLFTCRFEGCLSLRRNAADKIISFQVPPREKDPLSKSIKNLRSIHSEISPVREHSSGLLLSREELSFSPFETRRFNFQTRSLEMHRNSLDLFICRVKSVKVIDSRPLSRLKNRPPSFNSLFV